MTEAKDTLLNILIVDDAKFSATMIKKNLQQNGINNIQSADTAQAALSILQEQDIQVVIADWMMPEMDGIELTQHIRRIDQEKHRYTYIVMLTARDGVDALQHAFNEGVDDFVNKAVMQQQLTPRVLAGARVIASRNKLLSEIKSLEQKNSKLKSLSNLDKLTGLGNKNYCITKLMEHIRYCDSRGGAVCFLLLRIEHSDRLEKELPSQILSELIYGIAKRLKNTVRPLDDIARIDKYNFAVITHQPDLDSCNGKSFKRIKDSMNQHSFKTSMGFQSVNLAMSLSAACQSTGLPKSDELIRLAMQAMQQSIDTKRIEYRHYRLEHQA